MAKSGLERDVTVIGADIIQPVDIQSHYSQTIVGHNAVSIPTVSFTSSAWIDTDGFDKAGISIHIDASITHQASIHWSTDGVNVHSKDIAVFPTSTLPDRTLETGTRMRYMRLEFYNGDTVAHTMSSWFYLKA
jgi:hypothetical protein